MALLSIIDLTVRLRTDDSFVEANRAINLSIEENESIGIIGESGCGKSILGSTIVRLLPDNAIVSGQILYDNKDLLRLPEDSLRQIRGKEIAVIPQNPRVALNPLLSIAEQIAEVYRYVKRLNWSTAQCAVKQILEKVHLDPRRMGEYPHQFSGGMLHRAMIAMALASDSKLLIVDEITKGLDYENKWKIVKLLKQVTELRSVLLITHDLDVARRMCDRIVVMYAGEIVEINRTESIFSHAAHPYTRGLVNARPAAGMKPIPGHTPSLVKLPQGCRFYPRCAVRKAMCAEMHPPMRRINRNSSVRCW